MINTALRIARGLKANLPIEALPVGVPIFAYDTGELFVSNGTTLIKIGAIPTSLINGHPIVGYTNTAESLELQKLLKVGSGIRIQEVSVTDVIMLLTNENGIVADISASPINLTQIGGMTTGEALYSESTNVSLGLRRYSDFHVEKPSNANTNWAKLNIGTGPFTLSYRRKCSSSQYSGGGKILSVNNSLNVYNGFNISGQGMGLPAIPITEGANEEILITRLEDGSTNAFKNGQPVYTNNLALSGVSLDFSDASYFLIRGEYGTTDIVSGICLKNSAYTGGAYSLSSTYPEAAASIKDEISIDADATLITFTPPSGMASTNVQDAIEEVDNKLTAKANLVGGKVPLEELPELGGGSATVPTMTWYSSTNWNIDSTSKILTINSISGASLVKVYKNGLLLENTADYTLSNTEITFMTSLVASDKITTEIY